VLVITAGVYLAVGTITILEPLYARRVLHGPFTLYGWLLAVWGIAGIVTSVAARRWPAIAEGRWAVPAAALTLAAGAILYVNTTIVMCAFAGAAVFGAGAALFRLSARAVIVLSTPERAHGRALSLWESVQCAFCVAPTAATGTLVTLLGLRALLACSSALAGAVAGGSLTTLRPARHHLAPNAERRDRVQAPQRPARREPSVGPRATSVPSPRRPSKPRSFTKTGSDTKDLIKQAVAKLVEDTGLHVQEHGPDLIITDPGDPGSKQLYVELEHGYVSRERVP
jgi:hypothetical protein